MSRKWCIHNTQKRLEDLVSSSPIPMPDCANVELFKYFALVPPGDNKFVNSAVWSGGSAVMCRKAMSQPVQSYFVSEQLGQFERTLIIVDDDADIHYLEGCTAQTFGRFFTLPL